MIFPVAHEHMGHRRWPIITIVIVALCLLVHVVVTPIEKQRGEEANRALNEAFSYHAHHPYLQLAPPLDNLIGYVRGSRPRMDKPDPKPDNEDELRRQQAHFDNLTLVWQQRLDDRPRRKFGYVPARGDVLQIITHQFLHGDWIHLLSNMWFLWLCGVNLEDRWGRLIYGPFFLASGIAAALVELFFGGIPDVPRIGASGAIAGAMGAFLIVYSKTRIRFVTFIRVRPFFFTARAYVMLPLWFASELFSFFFGKVGSVAYGAHVGGFVFGLLVALVLQQTGVDKKLDQAIEEKITVSQDPRIVEASDLTTQGRAVEALTLLDQFTDASSNIDVQLETLRAAKAAGQTGREMEAYGRLLQLYIRDKQNDAAITLLREVRADKRLAELPAPALMTMGQTLEKTGLEREATDAYDALHRGNPTSLVAVKAMLAQAKIEVRLGAIDHARELFTIVRESPFSTKELDDVVDEELKKLPLST